jgi:hypothetical protein
VRRLVAIAIVLTGCASAAHRVASPPPRPTTSSAAPTTALPPGTTSTTSTTVDPGTLPQTGTRPSGADPAFLARINLLWQAIVTGGSAVAVPAFFPEAAYLQVKAIANADADWHQRLLRLYDADIARLHARVAGQPATLVSIDVPDAAATWVPPGAEYNKGSYWRVYGTVVHYLVGGRPATFPVRSLISWRGEWYVVHFTTPP